MNKNELCKFVLMMLLITVYIWTIRRNLELPVKRYKSEAYDITVALTTLSTFMYLLYTL